MTEDKKHHSTAKVDIRLDTSLREWVLSGITGVMSGLIAAGAAIRREFNEEVKHWPGIADYTVADRNVAKEALAKNRTVTIVDKADPTKIVKDMSLKDALHQEQECDTVLYKIKGMLTEHEEKLIEQDKTFLRSPGHWQEHQKATGALKREYANHRAAFLENSYGIKSGLKGLISGTLQRHGFLGDSTKATIAFAGISTAVIVGVTTLGLFNGVATRNKTKKIEDNLDTLVEHPQR